MNDEQRIHQLFTSFREANQAFAQVLTKPAQEHGITPIQLLVLKTLSDQPDIGLNELSDCIQLGSSTVSGIINRMVKAGLVTRDRSNKDRRTVSLNLTERGKELWNQVYGSRYSRMISLLDLSEADQDHLMRIHSQIVAILQTMREEPTEHESSSNNLT